jgi:carbonic anhydrase/acetyltransferase-like protein (isoleucine patch superfamily)
MAKMRTIEKAASELTELEIATVILQCVEHAIHGAHTDDRCVGCQAVLIRDYCVVRVGQLVHAEQEAAEQSPKPNAT